MRRLTGSRKLCRRIRSEFEREEVEQASYTTGMYSYLTRNYLLTRMLS